MRPFRERGQHIESATVGVGEREECEHTGIAEMEFGRDTETNISGQILSRQHDSFREPGSAGGVVDFHYFRIVSVCVKDVAGPVAIGIFSVEPTFQETEMAHKLNPGGFVEHLPLVKIHHTLDSEECFGFKMFPNVFGDKKEL